MIDEPVAIFLTIMAVILITPLLSERARLPGIVGLILGGMLIGPYGLNLLDKGGVLELLAAVGILYLMFSAGLEVDLHQFNKVRGKAIIFGVLTFFIPQILGTILGRVLGLGWVGAVLLGSAVASHTLIAFPVANRLGIVTNEAVSVTIGATVLTDIAAFLVLAAVAGTPTGSQISTLAVIKQVAFMLVYAAVILFAVPRAGKLFFQRFSSRAVEFQFMLVVLLVAAFLAELIGMHAVVGAFLAGLAINSALPPRSAVASQVLFMGESFFIPIFLMHSGMLTDPRAFFVDMDSLIAGVALTGLDYLAKLLAAWAAGRVFHYSKDQVWTIWGLSQAQAAVTLPTMVVGLELGLFPNSLFNAAIMMILFTSLTSPMIVQHFGARLMPAKYKSSHASLFERILVPIANPSTQESLLNLAELLVRSVNGILMPLNVARESAGKVIGLDQQQQLIARLPEMIKDPQMDIQPIQRVDSSIGRGILRSTVEHNASMILMGWTGLAAFHSNIFGSDMDNVFWGAEVPVFVARMNQPVNGLEQVVWAVTPQSSNADLMESSFKIIITLARELNVPLRVFAPAPLDDEFRKRLGKVKEEFTWTVECVPGPALRKALLNLDPNSLLITTTRGIRKRFRSVLGSEPEEFAAIFKGAIGVIRVP